MSKGLVKAKKYDWKNTNMALFGSDTEKAVKKESAESEPAWAGAGQDVGVKIWRIVKFEVKDWPEEDYGKFYSGDSYIILNTYKEDGSDELLYDVHFWIGKYSTQDEYGTVAYKTVELDTFLDDKAVQHREVQGYESSLFKSYFETMTLMEGGAETGFRHVRPEEYVTRLLHFSRTGRTVTMKEVPCNKNKLNSGDVFIVDAGNHIWTWVGSESNKDEKFHAAMAVSQMKQGRGSAKDETIEEGSEPGAFFEVLLDDEDDDEDEVDAIPDDVNPATFELYSVSDASGYLEFNKVKEGGITRDDFCSDDVFLFNTGKECFIFIGSGASPNESKNGMGYAHAHLAKRNQGLLPICVLREGRRSAAFDKAIAA